MAESEPREQALRAADEGDLCRLWAAQALPTGALVTTDGEQLQVIYPGRRSGAGGPDFRGAILADAAGRVRTGDVELHLRSRDWITHGHRADPSYNAVVLHVVVDDDGAPCLRADGRPVPVLALGAWVAAPLATAAAGSAAVQPCRVSPALLAQDVHSIVRAAGRTRLEAKAAALEAQIAVLGAEQALFTALLDAAGYSRNRGPCGLLAGRLPVERLQHLLAGKTPERATSITTAVLLGLAGLLQPGADGDLLALWAGYAALWSLPPLRSDVWLRAGIRPANRPEVRLRGIATLVARHARDGLVDALLAPLRAGDVDGLLAALEVPAAPGGHTPPIGRGRAIDMAINVAAPFALARGDSALAAGTWRTIEALPAGEDADPLRHMRALLAGSGHRLHKPGALEQQGLLHLYRSHCSVRACWECPLAVGHQPSAVSP